ncbi:hypothetical protein EB796_015435 [Bugula neritina]|uniref:Uncharacterized protein n=1 Tax=Bugula neritina TaxID=10212 RepID=A0A7J7JIV0_BUGNE|nr:hypothetical protein EB796_015435 [Bugula neritina]
MYCQQNLHCISSFQEGYCCIHGAASYSGIGHTALIFLSTPWFVFALPYVISIFTSSDNLKLLLLYYERINVVKLLIGRVPDGTHPINDLQRFCMCH